MELKIFEAEQKKPQNRKFVIVNKPVVITNTDEEIIRQFAINMAVDKCNRIIRSDERVIDYYVKRFTEQNKPISTEQFKRLRRVVSETMPKIKAVMLGQTIRVVTLEMCVIQKEARLHITRVQVLININKILRTYGMQAGMYVWKGTKVQIFPIININIGDENRE